MLGASKSPWVKSRPSVLIIDDDREFVSLVESLLTAAGYSSVAAYDPVQGFIVARRDRPRLIVLDIAMPAGGGMQLLERLMKTSATKKIPVIVVTALREAELGVESLNKGAVGFLRKPLQRDALLATLETVLKPS